MSCAFVQICIYILRGTINSLRAYDTSILRHSTSLLVQLLQYEVEPFLEPEQNSRGHLTKRYRSSRDVIQRATGGVMPFRQFSSFRRGRSLGNVITCMTPPLMRKELSADRPPIRSTKPWVDVAFVGSLNSLFGVGITIGVTKSICLAPGYEDKCQRQYIYFIDESFASRTAVIITSTSVTRYVGCH